MDKTRISGSDAGPAAGENADAPQGSGRKVSRICGPVIERPAIRNIPESGFAGGNSGNGGAYGNGPAEAGERDGRRGGRIKGGGAGAHESEPQVAAAAGRGTLYMIPCPIAEGDPARVLPADTLDALRRLDYFIVENVRTARRFLARIGMERPIAELELVEFSEHTPPQEAAALVEPLLGGRDAGFLSEAGAPGVADPGAAVADQCHRRGLRVTPLVGPSSLLLALMASGQGGQSFAFAGYLPVKPDARRAAVRRLERFASQEGQTQLFIETPYRNAQMLATLLETLRSETMLTVAAAIGSDQETVLTFPVGEWRRRKNVIGKIPAVFIIGCR